MNNTTEPNIKSTYKNKEDFFKLNLICKCVTNISDKPIFNNSKEILLEKPILKNHKQIMLTYGVYIDFDLCTCYEK